MIALCMAAHMPLVAAATDPATSVEVRWSNQFTVTVNEVTGPGAAWSSLPTGTNFFNVYQYDFKKTWGDRNFSFGTAVNLSSSKATDPKSIVLSRLELKYSLPGHAWAIGDTMTSFSPYALSGSAKGLTYQYSDPARKNADISLVYGIAYPRWDNFWDSDTATRSIQRKVAGARIGKTGKKFDWGFSAVRTEDSGRITPYDYLYDNLLFAADWAMRPDEFWTFTGEHSRSGASYTKEEGVAAEGLQGWAHRISAVRSAGRQRFSLEWEEVTPQYTTLMGSATVDRERVKLGYRDRLSRDVTWRFTNLWFRDNLDGQKYYGTQTWQPELGISIGRLFKREYAVLDLAHRLNAQTYLDGYTRDHTTVIGYRDRFGAVDAELNAEISAYDTFGQYRSYELMHNLTLSTTSSRGKATLSPTLYMGFWRAQEALNTYYRDERWEMSLGLSFTDKTSHLSGSVKAGTNRLLKTDGGDNSDKWFANLELRWKPPYLNKKYRDASLFVRWLLNDFRFTTTTNNYRESSLAFGVNLEY